MINASKKFLRKMVEVLRMTFGVEVVDATGLTTRARREELRQVARERKNATKVLSIATQVLWALGCWKPESRYDLEYSTHMALQSFLKLKRVFEGTHYWFWSPIMEEKILRSIVGYHNQRDNCGTPPQEKAKRILDVGAGNGALLQRLVDLGFTPWQMTGVDISSKAVERIQQAKFQAIHGEILAIPGGGGNKYEVIFLSYFVDRDNNQQGTFERALTLLKPGGILVLEGLFPCIMSDSNDLQYGTANVTKGKHAVEDIQLVIDAICGICDPWEKDAELEKIIVGQRLVYSMDGPEVLPSYTLIFKRLLSFTGSH